MAEAIEYVVVCACDGKIEAVAYIDDNRAGGPAKFHGESVHDVCHNLCAGVPGL